MEKQGNEMKTIQRQAYLDRLIAFKDKDLIKVITGIRRCGKSTLLMMYRDWLMAHGISEKQLICLNFEDFEYYDLRQPGNLYLQPCIRNTSLAAVFHTSWNSTGKTRYQIILQEYTIRSY